MKESLNEVKRMQQLAGLVNENLDHDAPQGDSYEEVIDWLDSEYPDSSQYNEFVAAFEKELEHLLPGDKAQWRANFKRDFQNVKEELAPQSKVQGTLNPALFKDLNIADFEPTKFTTTVGKVKNNQPLSAFDNKLLANVMVAMIKTPDDAMLNKIFTALKAIEAK